MAFAQQVRNFTTKAEAATDKTIRAITFALFREVIMRTPVDTGRLKGNWQTSQGAPVTGTVTTTDPSGGKAIVAMAAAIGGWGSVSYLANNLPYAHRVEYDGWSHTKAPAGMVRVSLARINAIVAKATRDNKV